MSNCKSVHPGKYNILFTTQNGELFVVGDNYRNKTGIITNGSYIGQPMSLGIKLNAGESVKSFVSHIGNLFIYTDQKRLIIPYYDAAMLESTNSLASAEHFPLDSQRSWKLKRLPSELLKIDFCSNFKGEYNDLDRMQMKKPVHLTFQREKEPQLVKTHFLASIQEKQVQLHTNSNGELGIIDSEYQSIRAFSGTNPVIISGINEVIFGITANIYLIGNRIIAEIFSFMCEKMWKNMQSLPFKKCKNHTNCYELTYSFANCQRWINRDFLLLKEILSCSNRYHVLIPCALRTSPLMWMTFETDFEIDINHIYWNFGDMVVYVSHDNIIYYYEWSTQRLEKLIDCNAIKTFMIDLKHYHESLFINETGIYSRDYFTHLAGIKISDYPNLLAKINPYFSKIKSVCCSSTPEMIAYYILCNNLKQRFQVFQKVPYINIQDIKYYGAVHTASFAFIHKDHLNIISRELISSVSAVKSNIENVYHQTLKLPFPESAIIKCEINGFILIETQDAFFYTYVGFDFQFKHFSKHMNLSLNLINREQKLLLCAKVQISNDSLNIQMKRSSLDEFLAFVKMNPIGQYCFRADHNNSNAIGIGSRYLAIETVLNDFADRFLIQHNHLTTLNLKALSYCDDVYLNLLGKALVMAFINLGNHLSIRLPLLLLAAICRCSLTLSELEFFAHQEDATAFESLQAIKDSKSYAHDLRSICKLDACEEEVERSRYYACAIADGFLREITIDHALNMNLPTLDWCLSGDYDIDIADFVFNHIYYRGNFTTKQKNMFSEYVRKLSIKDFRNLLLNWSGTSHIRKRPYIIRIANNLSRTVDFNMNMIGIDVNPVIFDNYDVELWNAIFVDPCICLEF